MTPNAATITHLSFSHTGSNTGPDAGPHGGAGTAGPPVVVTRRRRRGQDRAYVRVQGRLVGFRDLYTGVAECSVVEHLDTLMDVTDDLVHLGSARPAA